MALGFKDGYVTSIFGSRLGLQALTSGQSGSTTYTGSDSPAPEFLIGPDQLRTEVSTVDTTAKRVPAWGISYLTTSTGATTESVYQMDPPIPGVRKTINFVSTNTGTNSVHLYTSTGGTINFNSSNGTTMCVLGSTAGNNVTIELLGINSTMWAMIPTVSTAVISQTTVIA